MSNKPSLSIKQGQQLQISNSLQQAIKLLQLPTIELVEFLALEIEKNPLLSQQDEDNEQEELPVETSELRYQKVHKYNYGDDYNIEDNESGKTLREHVLEQIYLDIHDKHKRMIALNLADLLTEAGYIEEDLTLIATKLGVEFKELEEVLYLMQKFDPPGIFARNLAECLRLQLQDLGKLDESYELLLENLQLISSGGAAVFKKTHHIADEDFALMIKNLKSLNPKPGSKFIPQITNYMEPEVFVRREKNRLIVELNNNILPKILVNRRYYAEIRKKTVNQQEKNYLSEQLSTANWLIKALDQRANTLLRVATEIISRQHEFFDRGINYLRPMTIKDISSAIDLHESSISRITSNKFMSTPSGLFEMKYFFSSGVGGENTEDDYSSTTIKHLIKKMIDEEEKPLSDNQIAKALKEQNINIARRTVTKYRESLNIPTSALRKIAHYV
ncbi:RNA polymerase sigma-54 factor 1 [Candidatus Arcanobacter lacustris]|jgi:RNA polymerase sigma-54 factor|uniref:RNA polymerase sigma-54 factor n=1 Tax=Candidatus Arcanibacter lacustris TaxID=1607817 RepID=A0A0F5MNK1_9RICK|nr:RNA polymerase sigma-54 factor 1 [Candidatus Arcanobacter lacustris]